MSEIHSLVSTLRSLSLHKASNLIANLARANTRQENLEFLYEDTINCFYIGQIKKGMDACEQIIHNTNVKPDIKNGVIFNQSYYLEPTTIKACLEFDFERQVIDLTLDSTRCWSLFNPSIIRDTDTNGYWMIARSSNYYINNGSYIAVDKNGMVRTRNYLVRLDNNFGILWKREILDNITQNRYPSRIIGMEDCRLFQHQRSLYFTCTTLDNHPHGVPQISLGCLGQVDEMGISRTDPLEIQSLTVLKTPGNAVCEKNWLPFTCNNAMSFIYQLHPTIILDETHQVKSCQKVSLDLSRLRGSAGPIQYRDGWLCLAHEVSIRGSERIYSHRWIRFNDEFRIVAYSQPFVWFSQGVEYCCGLCWKHCDNLLVVPVGIADASTKIVLIDPNDIEWKQVE